ncbi:Fido domain-containing protein [Desulfonema limicola]|uniref:Fido domain-containing protein n=1 Tax=Desulfonema limicola TaxID=45656 RepID=A0A975GF94_9BACT|nr:Fic family protein [Desulfonema limicola]QTA78960.1 Fido domain-containing protein [Desulfonema limicola]
MIYNNPFNHMTPFFPSEQDGEIQELAVQVIQNSAKLSGNIHEISQKGIIKHLRIINSYYSNRIEGNFTHPIDIERAINNDYSKEPEKRELQVESKIHVDVQEIINEILGKDERDICSIDFITLIHKLFYERLPQDLRYVYEKEKNEKIEVIPGQLRQREVKVGNHIPPTHSSLNKFLNRFRDIYCINNLHGTKKIIGAASSHHRLLWIHPFLDGNGRIARLYTDTYMNSVIEGYGLWTISRGFARNRDSYMRNLESADLNRKGNFDGRGCLSQKGLNDFCIFFLETCLDQIEFMGSLFEFDDFIDRLEGYVFLRHKKMIPGKTPLKKEAFYLLKEAYLCGEFNRGEADRLTGLSKRTARNVLKQLIDDKLLQSNTPKGPVHFNIPVHAANYLFPDLFPSLPKQKLVIVKGH